ncbi:MAG: hypothetical protein AAB647_02240 [Patescibacteria group bacterium]
MRSNLKPFLDGVHNLDSVGTAIDLFLRQYQSDRLDRRLGYVAGIITSDGPEKVAANMVRLDRYTEYLRHHQQFPVFACTDIFNDEVFARVEAERLKPEEWLIFWRKILHQGHITDVFLTPRWEISVGAKDEYQTAQTLGLQIHFVDDLGF